MERLISELEIIISDLAFGGISSAGTDICGRLELIRTLCRELSMNTGEELCDRLSFALAENDNEKAVKLLCRLSCYCECLKI